MGTLLFAAAVVVEIILAGLCIRTKSYQTRVTHLTRVAAFGGFALLAGLGVLDWGLRYYVLAAVLLLLAVFGTVGLMRPKVETRSFKPARVVLRAIGSMVLFFGITLPAIIFPQYEPLKATGPYHVATVTYTYEDRNRTETYSDTGEHRKLNVGLWYPEKAAGKYPLVVFSHGGMGLRTSNESLYLELASHGYVVVSIDHTYHALYTTDAQGHTTLIDQGYMQDLQTEDAKSDRQQSYDYYQEWMKIRTDDISFVIDTILAEATTAEADPIHRLVDTAKIGVMGHSLGGSAALGIGRIRDDIGAVIALESPFMYDIVGVRDGEFTFKDEVYPLPVLNVYSDSTWSHLAEWPQYARNAELLSATDATAFNVHIRGVGHFTLTDLALSSPLLARMFNGFAATTDTEYCLRTVNKVTLTFFDTYLKGAGPFTASGTY
jgi:dienelactone hydrolase